ncbi:fungal-specific transcription factor domain-containing protein [Leptodontidium sp. 2 PMI_412]|nr:fungal-specific transcription factor domain-containing protein [Leptodontidium sp. 2 PMI_412]
MSCVACRSRKLGCDRQRPLCAACGKSNRECTYLERRTVVRRRPKTLEERLALLEARLGIGVDMISASSESAATANGTEDTIQETDSHGKSSVKASDLSLNDGDDRLSSTTSQNRDCRSPMDEDFTSQEMICSRVEETLPPTEVYQELLQIYFDQIHPGIPMIHKQKFYTTMKLGPDSRPPLCLQFSILCLSSSVTPKYKRFGETFYQKARRYAEISEANGTDEAYTVYHAQCWLLIANFDAQRMHIKRAWMSVGKCIRLVQMIGLHRLDKHDSHTGVVPEAEGFIELEERRRTFWAVYITDRFAYKVSGWSMGMNEHEIFTHLPSSEYAFENDREETSISLADALASGGAATLSSPFAAVILATALLGHVSMHIYNSKKPNPSEKPGNCEFWAKHRELDRNILDTFMYLPDQFKVPAGAGNRNINFLNMTLQTATICLHQAAMKTARECHKNDFIIESMNRCIVAADAITTAARCIDRDDLSTVSFWSGSCLLMAGLVYCHDLRINCLPNMQSRPNLEFLKQLLEALGKFHSAAQYFESQLQVELNVLQGYQQHSASDGVRNQLDYSYPKDADPGTRSSRERATVTEKYHVWKVFGGLLQHDTDENWVVKEDDIARFPHPNKHVLDTKMQRQRSSPTHSSPGNEQTHGSHKPKVLLNQHDVTSVNGYDSQTITHNFRGPRGFEPWRGPTTGANWQWNSPASSTQDNRLDGRYEAPAHELFDPIFDNNNSMPQKSTVRVATDMTLRNEVHGLNSHLSQGNQSGAFDHEY